MPDVALLFFLNIRRPIRNLMTDSTLSKQSTTEGSVMPSKMLILRKRNRKKRLRLKSHFEKMTLEDLRKKGVKNPRYEELGIPYTVEAVYNPDWILPNGIIVET